MQSSFYHANNILAPFMNHNFSFEYLEDSSLKSTPNRITVRVSQQFALSQGSRMWPAARMKAAVWIPISIKYMLHSRSDPLVEYL